MRPYCRTREQSDIIRANSLPNATAEKSVNSKFKIQNSKFLIIFPCVYASFVVPLYRNSF